MAKGSKVLNPADKARREARKKELKKNKKQRQQVRSAVIEKKDPEQIISDLDKLDRFEFDLATNPTGNDTLYKDKRKRLKETFAKILEYYIKDDPERHTQLKKLESEYERRHQKVAQEFTAIKAATEVKLEDVFLPPEPDSMYDDIGDDDPLMSEHIYIVPTTEGIQPPGCPPNLPPDLKLIAKSLTMPAINLNHFQALPPELMPLSLPTQDSPSMMPQMRGSKPNPRPRFNPKSQLSVIGQRPGPMNQRFAAPPVVKPTKPAVIESKPVIFVAKSTKFVPASVRSKVKQVDEKPS